MNESEIIQNRELEDDAHYEQSIYKTFIDSSGELLVESLRHHFEHQRENICDLKFYSSDLRFVRAHRSIFAAVSPFLRNLIIELDPFETKEVCIFLPDIRYIDLQHLVSLVYTGRVNITKRLRGNLTKWLEALGISMVLNEIPCKQSGEEDVANKYIYVHDELTRHRNEKLMCQLCKKSFKTESYMKSHLLTHTGEKPYKCSECGKQFRYKDSLKAHTRDHTGEKFKCQYKTCDKEFNRLRELKDHQNIHPLENDKEINFTFACNICDAKFLRKKQLSNHMETHRHNVEPCSICGKIMKNVACLRSHMKNHTTTKNYSCSTCGKAFKRNFDLTVHLRIHNGLKPYKCTICQKTFSLSSTLAKHKRYHDKLDKAKELTSRSEFQDINSQTFQNTSNTKLSTSVISLSEPSLSTKELEMSYFTQNTIADALIDLSQSSAAITNVKDSHGVDNEQLAHKSFQ